MSKAGTIRRWKTRQSIILWCDRAKLSRYPRIVGEYSPEHQFSGDANMKQTLVVTAIVILFVGCNESKEGRIRNLESQIEQTNDQLQEFESRIEALESKAGAE